MNVAQLSKLWLVVGTLLLFYALNSWIVTQGGDPIFSGSVISKDRAPAAVVAIPVGSILLALASAVGWLHATRASGKWHSRIPIAFFETLDMNRLEARVYQASMLVALSLVPTLALVHFWSIFVTEAVVFRDGSVARSGGVLQWAKLTTLDNPAVICSRFDEGVCEGDATILPGLEAAVFALLSLAASVLLAGHWAAVFKDRGRRGGPAG